MDDVLLIDLIMSAVQAGAYSSLAREMPEARRGMEKMWAKYHVRASELADRVSRRGRGDPAFAGPWE